MKNIYELSKEEKSQFRKEFNKTRYARIINNWRLVFFILGFFSLVAIGMSEIFLTLFAGDVTLFAGDVNEAENVIESLLELCVGIDLGLTVVINYIFARWLKIKHDIKY